MQNNLADAITQYTAALAMPETVGLNRADCLNNLGTGYYRQNNFNDAITQWTTALAMPELVGRKKADCLIKLKVAQAKLASSANITYIR
jgi:Tfp pilus assembly protein PilF